MPGLAAATRWALEILFAGFMGTVFYKMLTGGIILTGLLNSRDAAGNFSFSPARAQMLTITLMTAIYYLLQVIHNETPGVFPPLPAPLVAVVGGSQAFYLLAKARALLFPDLGKTQKTGA